MSVKRLPTSLRAGYLRSRPAGESLLEINELMRPFWTRALPRLASDRLDVRLCGQAFGYVVAAGGVYFDGAYQANPHLDPADTTAHEALVNKLHIDDVVNLRRQGWEERCVAQAILLARDVFERASPLAPVPLEVVISVDHGEPDCYPSSTFRFYGRRGDPWLPGGLEQVQQPVARFIGPWF